MLFGNIDAVLPAAETFLADLELMWASNQAEAIVGDVCLKHVSVEGAERSRYSGRGIRVVEGS